MPEITSTDAPEVPQNVIDKKRAGLAAQEAAEKAAAEKAIAEAKKCTWATNSGCSSYLKLTTLYSSSRGDFREYLDAVLLSGHGCRGYACGI